MEKTAEDKTNILIVTGVLRIGGGAEKVAANLGNYLTDQGYSTHLLTFYETDSKYAYHGTYHSFNESQSGWLLKPMKVFLRLWRLYWYIKKHDIQTVYAFLPEANFYVIFVKTFLLRKLRVIVSVRNNPHQRNWLFKKLSRWLYPKADLVVSVTRAIEAMLQTDFALKNTTTIYNAIDTEVVAQKQNEPLSAEFTWLHKASPLLITIGRLIQQKGQWHLVRAFTQVVEEHPQATLIILGDGEYRSKLQQLIDDCGLQERIHLLGVQDNVYRFLAAADVFVLSSLWEGMPNTMLEALATGLPIVSTDCVSGPREIIAPELGVSEYITYPYRSNYGVLTAASDNTTPVWVVPSVHKLSPEEEQFAYAINDTLTQGWCRGSAYTAYQKRLDEAFTHRHNMQQWEALLVN